MKPMEMGNRNGESEQGTGTRNREPGMGNKEWGTRNGEQRMSTGNRE